MHDENQPVLEWARQQVAALAQARTEETSSARRSETQAVVPRLLLLLVEEE